MKKNILKSFVTTIVIICMLPIIMLPSYAQEDTITSIENNIIWEYNQRTHELTFTGNGTLKRGFRDVIKPSEILSVIINEGIIEIDYSVFEGCSNLNKITLPTSLMTIGEDAFHKCLGLKRVYISDLSAWCNIEFEEGRYPTHSNPLSYQADLYLNGELVTDLVIPDDVRVINKNAFYFCNSLKSVTIPETVVMIDDSAFSSCQSLKRITIPKSVSILGKGIISNTSEPLTIIFCGTEEEWKAIRKGTLEHPSIATFDVQMIYHPIHTWDNGTVIQEATEAEPGLKRFLCSECAMVKNEIIVASNNTTPDTDSSTSPDTNTSPLPPDTSTDTILSNDTNESTKAPEATQVPTEPVESATGCNSALTSTHAMLTLTTILGFAFIAKKRKRI